MDTVEELMHIYGSFVRYVVAPILPDQRDLEECCADVWSRSGKTEIPTMMPKVPLRAEWRTLPAIRR